MQIFSQEMFNIDNRTQILVSRIFKKIFKFEEAISDKIQRLFNIRDKITELSGKKIIIIVNQFNFDQCEIIEKF